MSLTAEQAAALANQLIAAEQGGSQIGLLTLAHPEMDMDDAYAVQKAICAAKLAAGPDNRLEDRADLTRHADGPQYRYSR